VARSRSPDESTLPLGPSSSSAGTDREVEGGEFFAMKTESIVAIGASSILALDASMLLIDERLAIFPLVFGLDLRYVLTIAVIVVSTVGATIHRVVKK
jgi:hypothetical protein